MSLGGDKTLRKKKEEKKKLRNRQEVNGVHSPSSHGKTCLHNPLLGGSGLRGPEIILNIITV